MVLEGVRGILALEAKLTNILSFARLMAIGLVGIWMAYIANFIGTTLFPPIGIFVGLFLHIINLTLLFLSPSVHAMRLNLYETFSQFYVYGGTKYQPFGTYNLKE